MTLYADSSFLVSLYLADSKARQANALLTEMRAPVVYTSFNRTEFRNALRNLVARREIPSAAVARIFSLIESDLDEGLLVEREPDFKRVLRVAEQLSARYGEKHPVLCVDLLHVASAHVLRGKTFLTFDRQQALFARETGLTVRP